MIPKFRAWHDETMHTDSVIVHDGKVFLDYRQFLDYEVIDGIELMQSTGLKDCDGQELFDGDIIEFDDTILYEDESYGEDNEVTGGEYDVKNLAVLEIDHGLVIALRHYKYGGDLLKDHVSEMLCRLSERDILLIEFLAFPAKFKIVGNIYQNKDLLEVKE